MDNAMMATFHPERLVCGKWAYMEACSYIATFLPVFVWPYACPSTACMHGSETAVLTLMVALT
eukprot:9408-Eustigmatos_ZCMA.PRE.1